MVRRNWMPALIGFTLLTPMAMAAGPAVANPVLMRFPNAHGGRIVFVAAGNLWTVPETGGTAIRLTADSGQDTMPRYSPDGKWIAYTASDQGNQDVYVIPAEGGAARRLTFHSDVVPHAPTRWGPDNMVVTWTPDSRNIVFLSRSASWNPSVQRLFTVPLAGGLPSLLPLDRGGLMTYGPDGHSIAYTRIFRDFRTWKRYDGGRAADVYTYDFNSRALTRITTWKGTDTAPMWVGRKIYFLSDRDQNRRANIWVYDLDSKQFAQVTHFTDMDVDFPSVGDNVISFQQGGRLWALDLPSQTLHAVSVAVPDDGTRTQPRWVDIRQAIRAEDTAQQTDVALSPNGARAAFSARGDIITVPAENGAVRNLTHSSNADDDHPAWSPDGTQIAYTTDQTSLQQVAVRPALGGPAKLLTRFTQGFYYTPVWSPDARMLAVPDANHGLWLVMTDGSAQTRIAQDPENEIHDPAFSPDSKWLAYSTVRDHGQREIHLRQLATGQDSVVSLPDASDHDPVFSPDGKYLYFISARHELPQFSTTEFNIASVKSDGIYVATLAATAPGPFGPRSDEGALPVEAKVEAKPAPDHKPGPMVLHVDLDGLMQRAVPLDVPPANIGAITARDSRIFYLTSPSQLIEGNVPGEESAVHVYDVAERKDEVVGTGMDDVALSADGKRILYDMHHAWHIADAKAGHGNDKILALDSYRQRIDPRQEWSEMFENAWRLERDLFVNPAMNGDDWNKLHDTYGKLLPLLGSRADLTFLIGEMQGELGNSHTYSNDGDDDDRTPRVATAMLGADYVLDAATGRTRIAKIYAGDNSRSDYRGPLGQPGIDVHDGDYLLAIDGQELTAPTTPDELLVGHTGPVTLTVATSTTGARRSVTVEPVTDELSVREHAWITHNRDKVSQLSHGRVGYIYLSDMESLGMEQFIRQFYAQLGSQALVIDDRWNNGGFIDQIVLERLRRVLVGMNTNRERAAQPTPQQMLNGPKVVLMNHYSASDGDIFPYYFRKYGLGQLVGTRTWGGVRGIRGNWNLLDGGSITVPEDSLYGLDGKWVIENHGVDPDVEVEDVPAEFLTDHDIQLETAVKLMTDQLDRTPPKVVAPPPPLPAYPADGQVPGAAH